MWPYCLHGVGEIPEWTVTFKLDNLHSVIYVLLKLWCTGKDILINGLFHCTHLLNKPLPLHTFINKPNSTKPTNESFAEIRENHILHKCSCEASRACKEKGTSQLRLLWFSTSQITLRVSRCNSPPKTLRGLSKIIYVNREPSRAAQHSNKLKQKTCSLQGS